MSPLVPFSVWSYLFYSQWLLLAKEDSGVPPMARTTAISVIDYCHRHRAYLASYHFPLYYYPVSERVRKWVGMVTDEDWDKYIVQVSRLYPLLFLPSDF